MTDHWLHHRLFSQPKRSRRIINTKLLRLIGQLPDDKYVAPELISELLNVDLPFPVKTKSRRLGDGAMIIELEPETKSKWQQFVEAWGRIGKKYAQNTQNT